MTLPLHDSFDYLPGSAANGLILLADHAGSALPDEMGSLGLGDDQFQRHIAYDIGVREVVERLAKQLDVPVLFGKYSRLLIDLNRGDDDPTLIMKLSDGSVIPGNLGVDDCERSRRIECFHQPYHDAVTKLIDDRIARDHAPLLLSIHSFTPAWKGVARPWHASVLWDGDDRFVVPLLAGMREQDGLVIGDNVPYSGELSGDTLNSHGTKRGIAHALIEIRQDLIADGAGQMEWGERLAGIVGDILADESFLEKIK